GRNLEEFIGDRKVAIATRFAARKGEGVINTRTGKPLKNSLSQEEIAAIVNVKSKFLGGELKVSAGSKYHTDDIFAYQSYTQDYNKLLDAKDIRSINKEPVQIWNVPQNLKFTYDNNILKRVDRKTGKATSPQSAPLLGDLGTSQNFVTENMVILKEQQSVYIKAGGIAAEVAVPGLRATDDFAVGFSGTVERGADSAGAGASFLAAASQNYGSLAAKVSYIGSQVTTLIRRHKEATTEVLQPYLYRLANNQKAAIEWSTLNSTIRGIPASFEVLLPFTSICAAAISLVATFLIGISSGTPAAKVGRIGISSPALAAISAALLQRAKSTGSKASPAALRL
ncbi:unnamed protein product, partial [marine sediment metagenome]